MGVNTGVASSAGEVLILAVGDVQVSARVAIALGQTEVDEVDYVAALSQAHQEVIRLDVPVQSTHKRRLFRYQVVDIVMKELSVDFNHSGIHCVDHF